MRRHRVLLPFLFLSVLLHVLSFMMVLDWRQQELAAEVFKARLRQVARFEPRRLVAERPVAAPPTKMKFRPNQATASPIKEATRLAAPPPIDIVPEPVFVRQNIDVATRADTFQADRVDDVSRAMAQIEESRDEARRESFDLLRVHDLAQGHERAVVLLDPTNRRNITGFVNLTRLRLRGAGGGPLILRAGDEEPTGGSGLEALARYMRDHTDLLVQVRQQVVESVADPTLMDDPVHFLIEGGGTRLIDDWPLLQLAADEREFLEAYMRQGGLVFLEGSSRFLAQAVELMKELLGDDAGIRPLPAEHPIYHSYRTFPAGFPGENKRQWDYMANMPQSWVYPISQSSDLPAATISGPLNLDPNAGAFEDDGLDPLGLWGVSLGDTLVAIVSDLNLHENWFGANSQDDAVAVNGAPALVTGVNLIVHALTRRGAVAKSRALPAWLQMRPKTPSVTGAASNDPADESFGDSFTGAGEVDPGLYDALDGSIAIVRAPLGTTLGAGGVTVRVDGEHRVDVLRANRHGLMLHNLASGDHWIQLEYADEVEGIDVRLRGGQVATVTFRLSRVAMLKSVHLQLQEAQVAAAAWRVIFSDLDMEEVFFEEDDSFPLPP